MNISELISKRAQGIGPFLAMELLTKARNLESAGRDIIHMELGEPDRSPPQHVGDAAIKAIKDGYSTYTPTQGIIELREAVSLFYQREYGVGIDPGRIIVTMGVSPALFLVFSSILNRGDEVIIHEPYYPPYPQCIKYLDGKVRSVKLDSEAGFPIDTGRLIEAVSNRTKAILINSPSNPTGMMADRQAMKALAESGVFVISDEIYHRITYSTKAASILEFTDNCIVMNGFSKVFGMTGWRLGWIVCPEKLVAAMQRVHQNFFLSANSFVQKAAVHALNGPQEYVTETIDIYDQRRRYLIDALSKLGWELASNPQGAFYLLVDVSSTGLDGMTLADRLLEEAEVAVTPGLDFGETVSGYIRFSYATAIERIEEGVSRIEKWLGMRERDEG
ncbi:pyridoxal phosphate-dependent aminotransferase [bacterium]|nr:pyridoxal phosphate-dependent aminotransferase [bacterium]